MSSSFIDQLAEKREELGVYVERTCREYRDAGLSDSDALQRDPALGQAVTDFHALGERLTHMRAEEARAGGQEFRDFAARVNTPRNTKAMNYRAYDHLQYAPANKRVSWIRDLMRVTLNSDDTGESRSRLMRHADEVSRDPAFLEFRDLSRTDGQGGYAVPPAWLMNQYVELARPGRAFANLVQRQPLPGGTDSINLPKVLSGTTVGIQTADNQTVSETDLTDTFINAPVRTISGQQGVAIQLIDQSPIAFDDVIFRDLVAAHAAVLDGQLLSGTGANGQVLGVNHTPGIQTITVDSQDITGFYNAIANAIQLVHTNRFLPPEVVLMHPRRWAWCLSLLDTTHRPLFLPNAGGNQAFNAAGILTEVASQQVVGNIAGLPIVTDPNLSTTSGSEYSSYGNEDIVYCLRASDLILYEGSIRARVLPEVRADTLTVLLQIFSYFAFTAARYPASVVAITGLESPLF